MGNRLRTGSSDHERDRNEFIWKARLPITPTIRIVVNVGKLAALLGTGHFEVRDLNGGRPTGAGQRLSANGSAWGNLEGRPTIFSRAGFAWETMLPGKSERHAKKQRKDHIDQRRSPPPHALSRVKGGDPAAARQIIMARWDRNSTDTARCGLAHPSVTSRLWCPEEMTAPPHTGFATKTPSGSPVG